MNREEMHVTNLEEIVKSYLDRNRIDYTFQYSTRTGFVIDFALVDKKIAIEVDGKKWHSSEEAVKHDRFKDYMLKREDWKVLRIKEDEINNLDNLLSSIYLGEQGLAMPGGALLGPARQGLAWQSEAMHGKDK